VAIYRGRIAEQLPSEVPGEASATARDTLGGAVEVAGQLPGELGAIVLEVARSAFVSGMQLTAGIAAVMAMGLAIVTVIALRSRGLPSESEPAPEEPSDQAAPLAAKHLETATD
jgi:DHA2 family multidrug resistance protein-like MFS transporter